MKEDGAKGRQAVEEALIEAAGDLLAQVGPRATTVRDIAARAGVNHGQVHHYFGGKRGLLKETMRRMARAHHEAIIEISGAHPVPPPLATPADERYWRAVVRATIEGDIDLAGTEVEEGVSVSRQVLEYFTARRGLTEAPLDLKVALAEGTATQLGWMALEPFLFLVAGVEADEEDAVRDAIRDRAYTKRSARP